MTTDAGFEGFEPFDPTQEPSEREAKAMDEFEDFDVTAEPEGASDEFGIESLGDFSDSEDELRSVLAARDEAERVLMGSGDTAMSAMSAMNEDGTAGIGNIVGVGIAEKVSAGGPTGQLGVTIFVKEKVSSRSVSAEALVPHSIGGVTTDVEAVGDISAQMFTARRRPAPGGVSIGNALQNSAGTLGCLVRRGNQLFILSNNHVMALVNTAPLNSAILQPGRLDGGTSPADIIGRLDQFVPINFNPAVFNFVDAAIARTAPALVDRRILRPGGVLQPIGAGIVQPAMNLPVMKSGRTTQFRRGVIDAVNVTVNVNYGPVGGVARFARQFRVRGTVQPPFSDRGDSGSLVTTQAGNRPVGLLFAGNAQSNTTFCNPIGTVLSSLNVQIVI